MQKFRPYLTASELQEIINCLKSKSTNVALIRYLETFAIKIDHGTIMPNLTLRQPKPTIEQSLGFGPPPNIPTIHKFSNEEAWNKYQSSPENCTPIEISIALEYGYTNDLLTSEQESAYENHLMSLATSQINQINGA